MRTLILLRHAERPSIPDNQVGNEAMLTEKGKQDSLLFASQIDGTVVRIKSSPIGRCIQTAELIATETGYPANEIETSCLLGDPGFIIEDGELAWKHWQEKGHSAVNQHLLSGKEHWDGFSDLNKAVNMMTEVIQSQLAQSDPGVHIWVTHDTILATYASRILPRPLSMDQWPDFLGFLTATLLDDGKLSFSYQANLNLDK